MDKLRECPFCGSEAYIHAIEPHKHMATWMPDYDGGVFIECTGCECGMSGKTRSEVTAAWNRRHSPKPKPLTLEQLREMAKEPIKHWVWIENKEKSKDSGYMRTHADYTDGESFCCGYPGMGYSFDYSDYGKTWLAYTTKPETEGRI